VSRQRASMEGAGLSRPVTEGEEESAEAVGSASLKPPTGGCRFAEIALRGIITTPLHPEAQPCN
jgi:hypothetical protein